MKSVTVFALRQERKKIIEYLQRQGTVDITRMETENAEDGFEKIETAQSANSFERSAAVAERAVDILSEYVPKKTGLLS